jgi:hypothetical protein
MTSKTEQEAYASTSTSNGLNAIDIERVLKRDNQCIIINIGSCTNSGDNFVSIFASPQAVVNAKADQNLEQANNGCNVDSAFGTASCSFWN